MSGKIKAIAEQAKKSVPQGILTPDKWIEEYNRIFAELIVQECIDKIETYHIPVGNSAAGEMAGEWTYDALKEIRDDIKQHFGIEE